MIEKTFENLNNNPEKVKFILKIARLLFSAFLTYVLFFGLYENYSDGSRIGTMQKLSKKGLVFKSVEGDIVLLNNGFNQNSDVFSFSSRDDELISKSALIGKKVQIEYSEYLLKPIFISTHYNVKKITIVK